MKYFHFLLLFFFLHCFSSVACAQQRRGLLPSFPTVTQQEPLWIVHLNRKTYQISKSYADSLVRQDKVEDLKIENGAAAMAVYGVRGSYGVIVVKLKKTLRRIEYKEIRRHLKAF
ncbi:hypothetical protein [Pedobacter sp. SYP-B3415]|uniref:hypothetical protein n=1 Tax=Pedobacter sp. SYP-B3415 TaxID=2496641 RepID=UPI00101D6E44|nr:hypothetical protein [Pedobacter sp. SYP-B3415]